LEFLCKEHNSETNFVLAVCDQGLCGKTFTEGNLELKVGEFFFKGEEISEAELRKRLHEFENINIIGNESVKIAIEEKLATEENVVEIAGVKHVQIFKI